MTNNTAQALPSGMTAGGQARLDRLINEFGYKPLGFVETKYGKVFLAEKLTGMEQKTGSLYSRGWKVLWSARDTAQELDCPLGMSPATRAQKAMEAAIGFLMDRNDVFKEV